MISTISCCEQYFKDLLLEYPQIRQLSDQRTLYYSPLSPHTIPILSGGGSGHEPAHFGYVGKGMLAGAVAGELFIPPKKDQILEAIRYLNQGKGVFLIIKNFEADLAEFQAAIELAKTEGIPVASVVSADDISVEESGFSKRKRGVAGTLFLHKILGQAAQEGASLSELEDLGHALIDNIATLGVASKPTTSPFTKLPMFQLPEGFISFGVGIHGEAGYKTVPFMSLEKLAVELVNKLKMNFRWQAGDSFALLINNLGQTALEDEIAFSGYVIELLELEGLTISYSKHGKLMTSLDMNGLSLSMCHLKNPKWLEWLTAPTDAPAWQNKS